MESRNEQRIRQAEQEYFDKVAEFNAWWDKKYPTKPMSLYARADVVSLLRKDRDHLREVVDILTEAIKDGL